MIPNIPAVNKLSFSSSGKEDRDDPPGLLDLFPLTSTLGLSGGRGNRTTDMRGGFAACTFCTKRDRYYEKLLRVRRASDNEEVDVYPYKINASLFALHPNSKTSLGNTLKEFANGGKTHCVRVYDQTGNPDGVSNPDLMETTTSSQPEITDSNGDCFPIGDFFGINFDGNTNYGMRIFGLGNRVQHPLSILSLSNKPTYTQGNYVMGNFMTWYFGDIGNFGGQVISCNFGTLLSGSTSGGNPDLEGENMLMIMSNQSFNIATNTTMSHMGAGAPPTGDIKDFIQSHTGPAGTSFVPSGDAVQTQYGDFYIGSNFRGILPGPIFWDRTWITPGASSIDIMRKAKEITGLNE